ncbi:mediator of RNA polymerase II transcription subunit 8 [Brachionus plicatilis]|uniref:Mediator of RNA polymerase II transcription subunit 8 n=1 Tax=Brachionus plicatilis TaxID=10195 RepID=A0A3M7SBE0_BRAPC|nr:mediator of RNA polymerase II transcription subunit 8 [Brachionus plicatilis]
MDQKVNDNLDSLIHDLKECKYSLEHLLVNLGNDEQRLAYNEVDWLSILNSLRIASTNLISISNFFKHLNREKRDFSLKTSVVLPKVYSEEVDPELQELTDGRISVFNHDVIPHIMRTKLIPSVEEEDAKLHQAAKDFELIKTFDKNISFFKKTIEESASMVEKPKRDLETKQSNVTTYNLHDTFQLVNSFYNLKIVPRQPGQR